MSQKSFWTFLPQRMQILTKKLSLPATIQILKFHFTMCKKVNFKRSHLKNEEDAHIEV